MPRLNPISLTAAPAVFMLVMAALTGVGIVVLSWLLGGGKSSQAAETIYECGLDPLDTAEKRFPVKFYVVAMLFILFDVEIALLVPWAVLFGQAATPEPLRLFAFFEFVVFLAILAAGYVYLYRSGAFDWAQVRQRYLADGRPRTGTRSGGMTA